LDYDILKIVHSHPDGSAEPSEHDKKACKFLQIPYMIISWPEGDIVEYE
jgi:proteasome lid subunit RPN8/RPN11